ncbi:MAG: GrpB family protein, partial [Anaerolineales bacterium]|nr:GrpB family protein [Anaerolineales bacterium]
MPEKVELHPNNPLWPTAYQSEAALLKPLFGREFTLIEHIGSTAIPGLRTKPIIDILVVVDQIEIV